MLRTFPSARRKSARNAASAFAMAAMLAGSAMLATAVIAPTASAQEYAPEFAETYDPVAEIVFGEGGDIASVRSQLGTIASMAQSPDELNVAGNLILEAGNKTSDPALQRQGIELQLRSGKLDAANTRLFNWYRGRLAYQMEDYEVAKSSIREAIEAGWTQDDPHGLLFDAYIGSGDPQGAIDQILAYSAQTEAAGQVVPMDWPIAGLAAAYRNELPAQTADLTIVLVKNHPSQNNWLAGLQVVNALNEFEPDTQLDLLRLMRETNAVPGRSEFIRYIEFADPRIMSNEVSDVLAEGLAAGEFQATGDDYYTEVKGIVDERMADDRAEAPELVAEAEADATGEGAMIAGDVLFSLSDFAGAEAMYAMARQKGGVDANAALTREAISQVKQGKFAQAIANLGQVSGERAAVARLWSAYAELNAS